MVDDRALRFRRRTSAGEPPNQTRTDSRLDAMLRGYMRNQREGARVREEGLGSSAVESGVSRGVVPDTLSARLAGIGADMVADPLNVVPGLGLVVGGVGKAGRLSAIVNRLNKSTDVGDFITPQTMHRAQRPNDSMEGLYRPGAQGVPYDNVPEPVSPYLFGLVPTEKLAPLREFDRMAEAPGQGVFGPDNVQKLMDHLAEGGKLNDPTAVLFDPKFNWAYLGEGNHRLAAAQLLGLEQLPATVWRSPGVKKHLVDSDFYGPQRSLPPHMRSEMPPTNYRKETPSVGRNVGGLDESQLARDAFDEPYIPPTMHPYLLKYFRPQ